MSIQKDTCYHCHKRILNKETYYPCQRCKRESCSSCHASCNTIRLCVVCDRNVCFYCRSKRLSGYKCDWCIGKSSGRRSNYYSYSYSSPSYSSSYSSSSSNYSLGSGSYCSTCGSETLYTNSSGSNIRCSRCKVGNSYNNKSPDWSFH